MKNKILLVLGLVGILGVWSLKKTSKLQDSSPKVVSLQSQDFDELVASKDVFLLDVHTPEQKHIAGTDAFIPYDDIKGGLGQLPEDKSTPILVYCRSGSMSKSASKDLVELGYSEVYDLVGGINAYRETHVGVTLMPETVELGEVIYKDGASTEFVLTNNTPNELKIERVTGSCACTQPSIEKDVLAPYESTIIKVKFEPSVHKDDSDIGDLVRLVFVDTDNENFEHLVGKITAKVVK
jgi:rhodanese-related sulfurtransferase